MMDPPSSGWRLVKTVARPSAAMAPRRRLKQLRRCLGQSSQHPAPAAAATLEPESDGHHSRVFTEDLASSHAPGVSAEEARFFKEHGLFIKRGLLDADAVRRAQDELLSSAEQLSGGLFRRDDPASWLQHPPGKWPEVAPPGPSPPEKDHRDYKAAGGLRNPITLGPNLWKHHVVGDADWMLRLIPDNPAVRGIAEKLLAGPVKPTRRARGVYTIFPTPEATGLGQGGGHTDTVAHPLCFMAYLWDAPPRNGAFTLWVSLSWRHACPQPAPLRGQQRCPPGPACGGALVLTVACACVCSPALTASCSVATTSGQTGRPSTSQRCRKHLLGAIFVL